MDLRKVSTAAVLALMLISCGPQHLDRVVDTTRTNPALYESTLPEDYVAAGAALALPLEEVFFGMLRAAEGASGTSVWHYVGPLGEYYVYVWDAGAAQGGFSLVNATTGVAQSVSDQLPLGHQSSIYDLADLVKGLKEMGYTQLKNPRTELPTDVNDLAIKRIISTLPPSLPVWMCLSNGLFFVFPESMIWFGHVGGSS